MIIEIITNRKKLTKSLVNQMRFAQIEQLRNGLVLGHFVGVRKQSYLTGFIEYNKEYYCFAANWKKGTESPCISRVIGRWFDKIDFANQEECDDWWECYEKAREEAMKTHIYV